MARLTVHDDVQGCLRVTLSVDARDAGPERLIRYLGPAAIGFGAAGDVASLDLFDVPRRLEVLAPALDRTVPAIAPGHHDWLDWWLDAGWAWFPLSLEPPATSVRGRGRVRLLVQGTNLTEVSVALRPPEVPVP